MLKEIFFWLFNFYFNSITSVGWKKTMLVSWDAFTKNFYNTIMEVWRYFEVNREILKLLCNSPLCHFFRTRPYYYIDGARVVVVIVPCFDLLLCCCFVYSGHSTLFSRAIKKCEIVIISKGSAIWKSIE